MTRLMYNGLINNELINCINILIKFTNTYGQRKNNFKFQTVCGTGFVNKFVLFSRSMTCKCVYLYSLLLKYIANCT